MKVAIVFLYLFLTLIYITPIADNGRMWGGINLITQFGFIGYLSYLLSINQLDKEIHKLFFSYVWRVSVANCFYILACMVMGKNWSYLHTDIFAYILGITFIVLLIHSGFHKNERSE